MELCCADVQGTRLLQHLVHIHAGADLPGRHPRPARPRDSLPLGSVCQWEITFLILSSMCTAHAKYCKIAKKSIRSASDRKFQYSVQLSWLKHNIKKKPKLPKRVLDLRPTGNFNTQFSSLGSNIILRISKNKYKI